MAEEATEVIVYTKPGRIEFVRESIWSSIEITEVTADVTGFYCVFRQPGIERLSFDAPTAVKLVLQANSRDQAPTPIVACPVLVVAGIGRIICRVIVGILLPIPMHEGAAAGP